MNFVIFPMFFASSALYPLWRINESSATLYWICQINPFTHAVELVRFALYGPSTRSPARSWVGTDSPSSSWRRPPTIPAAGCSPARGGPAGDAG